MKQPKLFLLLTTFVILVFAAAAAEAKSLSTPSQPIKGSDQPLPIAQNVELVKHEGGWVSNISIAASHLYIGIGSELRILDVSNPANPSPAGSLILDQTIGHVYATGNYVYVGNYSNYPYEGELTIVDVSQPAQPVWLSSLIGVSQIRHMALSGNYLYLGTENGVDIVDVSDPVNPWLVGHFEHYPFYFYQINKFVVVGDYLYLHDGEKLIVLDVADPANPIEIFRGDFSGWDIALVGHYLYILRTWADYVVILDITNPAVPEEVATYPPTHNAIAVEGNYAFLIQDPYPQPKLTILNVTSPERPTWVSTTNVDHTFLRPFQVSNGYVYLVYEGEAGLWLSVVDANTPSNPIEVNNFRLNGTPPTDKLQVDSGYLYSLDEWNWLRIFELSDPANPVFLGSAFVAWEVWDFAVHENFAYLTAEECAYQDCWASLYMVDTSNPLTPTHGTRIQLTESWATPLVKVFGEYAYIQVNGTYDITVFSLADPAQPTYIGYISAFAYPWLIDFTVSGHYFYSTAYNGDGALVIIDISNPSTPTLVGSYPIPAMPAAVNVIGSYAYVVEAGNGGRLHVIDVLDPTTPVEVSTYRPPWYLHIGPINNLAFSGHFAYLSYEDGLIVLDITDPAAPIEVAFYSIAGSGQNVVAKDAYIYAAANNAGWFILEPTPLIRALTPGITTTLTYTYYQHFPTHFTFPAASVTQPITIAVNPSTAEDTAGYSFARHTFGLSALQDDTQLPTFTFAAPITVTLHYSHDDIGTVSNEAELALWVWTEEGWQDATTTCDSPTPYIRDIINNVLTLNICQTGRFALFGPTHQRYLPFIDRN